MKSCQEDEGHERHQGNVKVWCLHICSCCQFFIVEVIACVFPLPVISLEVSLKIYIKGDWENNDPELLKDVGVRDVEVVFELVQLGEDPACVSHTIKASG
jgi:hypothetical protein